MQRKKEKKEAERERERERERKRVRGRKRAREERRGEERGGGEKRREEERRGEERRETHTDRGDWHGYLLPQVKLKREGFLQAILAGKISVSHIIIFSHMYISSVLCFYSGRDQQRKTRAARCFS